MASRVRPQPPLARPHTPTLPVRSKLSCWTLLLALHAWTPGLVAQDPVLTVSAEPGWTIPTGDFSSGSGPGEGVEGAATLGVNFTLHGEGWRSWYAGFSHRRFACESAGCDPGDAYRATGFNLGLLAVFARRRPLQPFLRLGAVTTRVETRSLPAPDGGVSDLGFGGEAGAGLMIFPQSPISLTPSLTVTRISSTLPGGDSLQLEYLTASVALVFAF